MVMVEPKWRRRGVATALVDEALMHLSAQGIAYLRANAVRRNGSAMRMLRRCGFQWVRTDWCLLGRDI